MNTEIQTSDSDKLVKNKGSAMIFIIGIEKKNKNL